MEFFNERIGRLKWFDISLIKLSVAFAILFLLRLIPGFMTWLHNTNVWWLLVLFIVVSIRPVYTFYIKN